VKRKPAGYAVIWGSTGFARVLVVADTQEDAAARAPTLAKRWRVVPLTKRLREKIEAGDTEIFIRTVPPGAVITQM
jgi:hypothetical protein